VYPRGTRHLQARSGGSFEAIGPGGGDSVSGRGFWLVIAGRSHWPAAQTIPARPEIKAIAPKTKSAIPGPQLIQAPAVTEAIPEQNTITASCSDFMGGSS